MSRIKLSDGTSWPRPCLESDDRPVNWAARYSTLTRAEVLQLASIAEAYGYLLLETNRQRRDQVCRDIRAALKAEIAEADA